MSKTTDSEVLKVPVIGATYPATVKGFTRMLAEANINYAKGYVLFSFVKIENKLAAVFLRTDIKPGTKPNYGDSFFGDDDEEPIPTHGY